MVIRRKTGGRGAQQGRVGYSPTTVPTQPLMNGIRNSPRRIVAVPALLVLIGCSERTPTAPAPKQISTLVVVSAPTGRSGLVSRVSRGVSPVGSSETATGDENGVYVSMPPGSVPGSEKATVQTLGTRQVLTVTMVDGGFDPTALAANVGDTLEVDVSLPAGIESYFAVVPPRRPPSLVRTDPPKGKTDVPLNTQIIIVFSDPIAPATLSGAVQLLDGSTVVTGDITLSPSAVIAVFTPASPLAPNRSYQLVVDTTLRNSRGEAPDSAVHVPFSTGVSTNRVVSLDVSAVPNPVALGQPVTYTVSAKDASGNIVTDFTGNLLFASTDQLAQLPGVYWFAGDDRGSHTFTVIFETPGTQTVTVTDLGNSSIHGSGIATVVSKGSLAVSGLPCSLVITAEDASGSPITGYTGHVVFSATQPGEVIHGWIPDYTFVGADRGVHTFSPPVLPPGSWTITATDLASSFSGRETITVTSLAAPFYATNENGHSVAVYASGASCNAAPSAAIAGASTALQDPMGIAVDAAGRVYVGDAGTESINIYESGASGNARPFATITGSLNPRGIALDRAGQLYVANAGNASVTVLAAGATDMTSVVTTITGANTGLTDAVGVAVDANDRLYVTNANANDVLVFAAGATGNATPVATIAGSNTGLNSPSGVALDNTGRLYVANSSNSTITVYDPGASGNATPRTTIAGSNTALSWPRGIALDDAGRLYVANGSNSTITVYAAGATGNATPLATIVGSNTGLSQPAFLAFPTPTISTASAPGTPAIAFQSSAGIEAINPDGSGRKLLIADRTLFEPVWSPDGTKLAFTRTADGWNSCDIYTARADGSGMQRITVPLEQPWCANNPAWSPDGRRIAFSAGPGGCGYAPQCFGQNIYVINADGSDVRKLFTPASLPPITTYAMQYLILLHPTWSPDGTKLAFECDPFATGAGPDSFTGVCAGNVDGTAAQRLVECCPEIPVWSPDGSEILFQDNDGGWSIGLMNTAGTNVRDLIANTGTDSIYSEPAWSPDGGRIVFTHGASSVGGYFSDLYLVNRDGTGLQRLTTSGDVRHPTWAPSPSAPSARRGVLPRVRTTSSSPPRPKP